MSTISKKPLGHHKAFQNMVNFYQGGGRSLLDFGLTVKYTKCVSQVRKYGPKIRKKLHQNDVSTEL